MLEIIIAVVALGAVSVSAYAIYEISGILRRQANFIMAKSDERIYQAVAAERRYKRGRQRMDKQQKELADASKLYDDVLDKGTIDDEQFEALKRVNLGEN